jgi:membrane protease YdiL (CAAX protease family)
MTRAAPTPRLPEGSAAKLRDTAKVIGWGLALYAAIALVSAYMKQNATGALAVQAVVAEFGAGRLAVAWSDPHGKVPTFGGIAHRATMGALLGVAAAVLVTLLATVTRGATLSGTTPAPAMLAVGLLTAALTSMRDELVLRGVVLRAFERSAPAWVALLVCGLAGAAATVGASLASAGDTFAIPWREALVAGLLAVGFAVLWKKDRGAWLAWGAHTAWLWTTGPASRGGLVDVRWAAGSWGGGELQASGAAVVGLAAVAIAGIAWLRRSNTETGRTGG